MYCESKEWTLLSLWWLLTLDSSLFEEHFCAGRAQINLGTPSTNEAGEIGSHHPVSEWQDFRPWWHELQEPKEWEQSQEAKSGLTQHLRGVQSNRWLLEWWHPSIWACKTAILRLSLQRAIHLPLWRQEIDWQSHHQWSLAFRFCARSGSLRDRQEDMEDP